MLFTTPVGRVDRTNRGKPATLALPFGLRVLALLLIAAALLAPATAATAGQKTYDPGVSDSDIKIGNIAITTAGGRAYEAVSTAEMAYFQMVNDHGGINGRKITFVQRDSETGTPGDLVRKLVEEDDVLLVFSQLGPEMNFAIRPFLNEHHVPQLFIESSSAEFADPANFPWTMGFFAPYRAEGSAYAKYVLQTKPGAKIAVLYADNVGGREYLAGVHAGLGDRAATMIVGESAYRPLDVSLDSPITALKNSGADVFFDFAVGPAATRAIGTAYDLGWHPLHFITNSSLSVTAFLEPAGLHKATGIITNARSKGWLSPRAREDPAVRDYLDWLHMYDSQADVRDQNIVAGYERAQTLVEVLKRCGSDLTRANVMHQATHLNLELGMLRPGIKITTSPTDYQPIKQFYLIHFDGKEWTSEGAIIGG